MTRFVWDEDAREFVDPEDYYAKKFANIARADFPIPHIQSDIEYISPLTGRPVTSRSERREELKRNGCREVDPSEFKPKYHSESKARKYSRRKADEVMVDRPPALKRGEGPIKDIKL